MKDKTVGFRTVSKREADGGRVPCRNGDLCRYYMSKGARIYSSECPYNCQYYFPVTESLSDTKKIVEILWNNLVATLANTNEWQINEDN